MPTFHLLIKGKVQGVFFRVSAKQIADKTGITGWIRNTSEGDVEAVVTGREEQLKQFISWCKKGPSRAKVTDVTAAQQEEGLFIDFSVRR